MYKFNVFGRVMSVIRINEQWQLFKESDTSMRVRVYDVVIPPNLEAVALTQYLDDIYHELASGKYPSVERIE
ncbi:hypothetical protein PSECIP111854_01215 [Pseudoalteromonas sp. CIP111854]|uniref:DUF7661 domain-containing protein n=1 Tax=Pseudoalteromonas holothuriae TaxID=2963714 RepID=A0A9W4VT49_9GAMM|nr:hypothetical protein [Pseudoalteromonas sp. CIP111854]CAH9053668.1 hypothetical protein PSECIP111854_01215 [Pseudoalteromonas sp. CIP111854]